MYLLSELLPVQASWALLVECLLKSVGVLAVAALAVLVLGRASAAVKHLVWLVAMLALAALPILTLTLPGWGLLPNWNQRPEHSIEVTDAEPVPTAQREAVSPQPLASDRFLEQATSHQRSSAPQSFSSSIASSGGATQKAALASEAAQLPWRQVFFWGWAGGAALLLMGTAIGLISVALLGRRARPMSDQRVLGTLDRLRERLGVRGRVRVLEGRPDAMPMTWSDLPGARPKLLPPSEAKKWDDARLEAVLLHELGHVKRRDCLAQALSQLVACFYWPNPLVWIALWRLRLERERACDDLVLSSGQRASDYAEQLLAVATSLRPSGLGAGAAIAMAKGSGMEGRVMALLDQSRSRRALSRAAIAFATALLAAVVVPVAMVEAAADDPRTGVAEAQGTESGDATGQKDEKPDAESQPAAGQNESESNPGEGEVTSDEPNDYMLGPPPGLDPRETVRGFLDRLAEGKKTINGIHGSWDHAWAWTTRQHGMDLSTPLAKRPDFKPIAHLGNDQRMMVLTGTARESVSSVQDRVGIFELVRRDNRWLIEKMMLRSPEPAWAYAAGFARSDNVQWHVLRSDLLGEWYGGGLLPTSLKIEADGTFTQRTGGSSDGKSVAEKGTWKLDGRRLTLRIDETTTDRQHRAATRTRRVRVKGDALVMEQIKDGEVTGNRWTYHRLEAVEDEANPFEATNSHKDDSSEVTGDNKYEWLLVERTIPVGETDKWFLTPHDGKLRKSVPDDRPAMIIGRNVEDGDGTQSELQIRLRGIHTIPVEQQAGEKIWKERSASEHFHRAANFFGFIPSERSFVYAIRPQSLPLTIDLTYHGILQVTKVSDHAPVSIKIRYKILTTRSGDDSTETTEDAERRQE